MLYGVMRDLQGDKNGREVVRRQILPSNQTVENNYTSFRLNRTQLSPQEVRVCSI